MRNFLDSIISKIFVSMFHVRLVEPPWGFWREMSREK